MECETNKKIKSYVLLIQSQLGHVLLKFYFVSRRENCHRSTKHGRKNKHAELFRHEKECN